VKNITTIIAACLITITGFSQAPQRMTYQAVVRNSNDLLVQNSPVGMRVSILEGSVTGSAVYVETHLTQTNQNGLLNIEIGGGTVVTGIYENGIFWAGGPYFLKTEIDPLGGANYTITATSELLSVPYSNYAQVSGSLVGFAWDFVGAYKYSAGEFTYGSATLVTYLGEDKVGLYVMYYDLQQFPLTFYGTVIGNTITFLPENNFGAYYGTAVKTGNSLDLTIYGYDDFGNPVPHNSILIKQ
jgi:hypothetical protein